MKRHFMILAVVAAIVMLAGTSFAGIVGTSHEDTTLTEGGACSACHLPHGAVAGGNRLWPSNPTTGTVTNVNGVVAELCAYCHASFGGATGSYPDAESTSYVYGDNSHGVLMTTSNLPNSMTASALDYHTGATDGGIDCTTCHNVHDDPTTTGTGGGFRPFLRADINMLCSGCHGARRFESGAAVAGSGALTQAIGAWGGDAYSGTGNPGSHPVGTDITAADNFGGATPISVPFEMRVPIDNVADGYDMGGHYTGGGTGGLICVTCHAVHGVQNDTVGTDNSASMTDTTPQVNFLAVFQGFMQPAGERQIANGSGDFNALCEACHQGAALDAGYGAIDTVTFNQNPGGTAFGHPIDDMPANNQWVTGFPTNWPVGGGFTAGTNVDPIPVCGSCHVTHPAANAGRSDEETAGEFAASEYILRNDASAVCDNCHDGGSADNNNHHPIGITYDSTDVGAFGLATVTGAAGDTLSCGTCHGGGEGAHNWTAIGQLGMAAGWQPVDNARGSQVATSMSITCIVCHYGADGDGATQSPTLHDGLLYAATGELAANFDTIGEGTHFIGEIQDTWANYGGIIDPYTQDWSNGGAGGTVGAVSRFGGSALAAGSAVLVCESCHELEPALNQPNMHLLLAPFVEEDAATQADTRSNFCEGCHLPSGSHPMTTDTVTRSGAALDTDFTKAWLAAPTDPNVIMADGVDIINCDNCHQVHEANTNSYTFILDTAEVNVGPPSSTSTATWEVAPFDATVVVPVPAGIGGDHNQFCAECHPFN